jgi:exopolysaccharide biosynthesis polyprenyl glycosylphosphotransferase
MGEFQTTPMSGKEHKGESWWPGVYSADASRPFGSDAGAMHGNSVRVAWTDSSPSDGSTKVAAPKRPFRGGRTVQLIYALIDVCIVVTNGAAVFLLRFSHGDPIKYLTGKLDLSAGLPYISYEGFLFLYVGLILLFCDWQDLYRTPRMRSAFEESVSVIKAIFFSTLLLTTFIYLFGEKEISRFVVAGCLILNSITLVTWRYAKRKIVIHRAANGVGMRNVVIVGAGAVGKELARQFEENKLLGYQFKGFLDRNQAADSRVLGNVEDLPRVARSEFLDDIFITIPSDRELVKQIAVEARIQRLDVKVVPELYDGLCWNAPIEHVGEFPVMRVHWRTLPTLGLFVKRVSDVLLSSLGLLVLSPILLAVAIAIRVDSKGPALYKSLRVGKKGRPFTCFKFRTMVVNADELKDSLRSKNERCGPFFKISEDPRVTRLGKFLRKYSLDELPQLWNVLRSEMTLVGPRPHPMDDFQQYTLDHLRRLEVKPGITGLWQTTARQDPSFETNMLLDLEYIDHWSFWLDCKILANTVPAVFRAEGS